MSGHHNPDKAKWANKETTKVSTFATSATNTTKHNQKNQRECMLKDGNHPFWKRKRTKGKRTETVLQMFIRLTPSEELFWESLRRQWLREASPQIFTTTQTTIQKRGANE